MYSINRSINRQLIAYWITHDIVMVHAEDFIKSFN